MTNAVLGGGISGLSATYYLSKSVKTKIKLYESSQRVGGMIKTTLNKNGTVFEHGPRTLRCVGIAAENTLQLVKELGMTSLIRPVFRSSPAAKNRMIYVNNQLITLPNSWTALFRINPPFIKPFIFAIINDLKTEKKCLEDESIYDFVARRFGKEYADIPLSAMVCGIFAGDAKEISVKALMNELFEKEQEHGSVIKGLVHSVIENITKGQKEANDLKSNEYKKWSVWSFENGLETLPKQLDYYLRKQENVDVQLGSYCSNVSFKNEKVLLTINGKTEVAKHVYSCLPSKDLAKILGNEHVFLKNELSAIPFVDVVVVNLEYEGDLIDRKGFGFLVPPNQNLCILGIIFDTCIFPKKENTVLTVMMGGRWFDHYFNNADEQKILSVAKENVKNILRINKEPLNKLVTIWKQSIPQFIVGHKDRVQRMRNYITQHKLPLTLSGNSFDGVGVNDAIFSAKNGVELALKGSQ